MLLPIKARIKIPITKVRNVNDFLYTLSSLGHTVDRCYKLHGYPLEYQPRPRAPANATTNLVNGNQIQNASLHSSQTVPSHANVQSPMGDFIQNPNSGQYQQLMTLLSSHLAAATSPITQTEGSGSSFPIGTCFSFNLNVAFNRPNCWIVDSGATRHICSNVNAFVSLYPICNSIVTLPNHISILVSFCGDIQLKDGLVLKNTLFVSRFLLNLLFVCALTLDTQVTIKFLHDSFVIQEVQGKKEIGKGDRVGDLYMMHYNILASHPSAISTAVVNHVQSVSPILWHNRLGYLSYKKLGLLKDVLCSNVSKAHKASPCYVCPLAKQRRLSFTSNNHVAHSPFDLIHCDI